MDIRYRLLIFLIFGCNVLYAQQYLISGCMSDRVAVIDRDGAVLWSHPVDGADSNDSEVTRDGNVLFAYKYGAKLVTREHEVLWDYKVSFPEEDLNTATELDNGRYLVAYCGHPARILELDSEGEIVFDLKYDTGIESVHSQFRQVTKTDRGSYLIPMMSEGTVREISSKGDLIREVSVGGTPFSVEVLRGGNWLVSGGDGHCLVEVDPDSGEIVERIGEFDLDFCRLLFVASTHRLSRGRTLFVNWGGHSRVEGEPKIVEIGRDLSPRMVLKDVEGFTEISSIDVIDRRCRF